MTASLIRAAAAGHGQRVKRMEPLWHAVRAELDEELEPLPAKSWNAVSVIREQLAESASSGIVSHW